MTSSEQGGIRRLKDDQILADYASQHQWSDRREQGMPWRMDVFTFIAEVYKPWLGHGLLQSDLKALDKKLYAQLQKCLSALPTAEKEAVLVRLKLPKERSDEAVAALVTDPVERAVITSIRRYHRERNARYRARKT